MKLSTLGPRFGQSSLFLGTQKNSPWEKSVGKIPGKMVCSCGKKVPEKAFFVKDALRIHTQPKV